MVQLVGIATINQTFLKNLIVLVPNRPDLVIIMDILKIIISREDSV